VIGMSLMLIRKSLIISGGMLLLLTVLYARYHQSWHAQLNAWRYGFSRVVAGNEPHWVSCKGTPKRIILYLHTWGSDLNHLLVQDVTRPLLDVPDTCVVAPNFNGPSDHPSGCGSEDSLKRIIAVADLYRRKYGVKVDIIAASGGAYHALLLMSVYSEHIAKASLWAPIYDLSLWYHDLIAHGNSEFPKALSGCFGHIPVGTDDLDYAARSPSHRLTSLDPMMRVIINHGTLDSVVPLHHGQLAVEKLSYLCSQCVNFQRFPGNHSWNAQVALTQIMSNSSE
jgi:pimeloyl-ACP methyl ester carboxylesterase